MWIDDFQNTLTQYFDTPKVLIRALGYWCAATALEKRVWIESPTPLFPNIYLIIVSPPGWFRKSSVSKRAIKVARIILGDDTILPNYASTEAFIEYIDGLENSAILYYDEFRSFMGHTSKEYASGIRPILVEMFDTDVIMKVARRGQDPLVINTNCLMNFLATTTDAWMAESMKESDIMSGFLSRFVLVECSKKERSLIHQPKLDASVLEDLARDLKATVAAVQGEMKFSRGGMSAFETCYKAIENLITKVDHPEFPSMIARAPTYVKKYAMVYAAMRGSMTIEEDDVYTVANEIVKPSIKSVMKLINEGAFDDRFQKMIQRTVKILQKREGRMSRRELLRTMRVSSDDLDLVLTTLQQQGRIKYEKLGRAVDIILEDELELPK